MDHGSGGMRKASQILVSCHCTPVGEGVVWGVEIGMVGVGVGAGDMGAEIG